MFAGSFSLPPGLHGHEAHSGHHGPQIPAIIGYSVTHGPQIPAIIACSVTHGPQIPAIMGSRNLQS